MNSLRPFHLRILFPDLLTLSKTDPRRLNAPKSITHSKAIDLELYTYFALLLRDFVHPWYKLMTTDEDLTVEVLDILTSVVQTLEERLYKVDWTELVLIDLTQLLSIHYHDYRQAKNRMQTDHASGCNSQSDFFHGMQPHFALEPIENREKEYLDTLTESILKIVLKPKEYQSDCVRHLVRDIISNLVLYNLIEVLADPYTVHTIICKALSSYEPLLDELETSGQFAETYFSALTNGQSPTRPEPKSTFQDPNKPTKQESLTKQMQRLQEARRQKEGIEADEQLEQEEVQRKRFSFGYITLQIILSPIRSFWFYLMATMTQSQERYHHINQHTKRTRQTRLIEPMMEFLFIACQVDQKPMLQWVWQMLAMFFWPLIRVFGGGLLVDKFLEQTVLYFLSEDYIVSYLRLGSDLLWPEGVFLQRSMPPTPLQKEQMRERAERLLTISIPPKVRGILFETHELNQLQTHLHETIEPLQNKQINKHLLYLLIDLILIKILPELLHTAPL